MAMDMCVCLAMDMRTCVFGHDMAMDMCVCLAMDMIWLWTCVFV